VDFPDSPFGPFAVEFTFDPSGDVTFLVTSGSIKGKTETVPFAATELAENLWFVSWQEENLLTVVQVHDFTTGQVTSAVVTDTQQLVRFNGTVSFI
jgi:ribosomal protein S11